MTFKIGNYPGRLEGKVLVIGPDARKEDGSRIAMDVSKGGTVLYAKYAGTEVQIENKNISS